MYMVSTDDLSRLQRPILVRAYDNGRRDGRTTRSEGCDGYDDEVVQRTWGFENRWAHLPQQTPERWHVHHRQIPYGRYQAALTSLSRSVQRLTDRGLVTRYRGRIWRGTWAGVKLTSSGLPVAKRLWEAGLARQSQARLQMRKTTRYACTRADM